MNKNNHLTARGFTILELSLSVGVLALIIGMAMSSWVEFMQKTNRINAQASLDMEARRIIEHFRSEMSKTSRDSIIFYPRNQSPYQAVSFALPSDQDGDGLMDMNPATSNILWRQTIVYHIFNQSTKPPQMRRTQFVNRFQNATFEDRYAQVEKVVAAGLGADACLDGETASTKVMFENLFTGRLWHAEAKFDCYAPEPNTRERINFGVTPLQSGPQQITFTVVDKNNLSTGRKIGLDRIAVGPSRWFMEAELIPDASSIPKVYAGVGMASAGYGLRTATSANGQQVTLTLNNDAIEECLFIGEDRNVLFSNSVVRLDTNYTPPDFNDGVLCAKLDGACSNAWRSSEQCLSESLPIGSWTVPTNGVAVILRIPILSDSVLNPAGEPNEYGIRTGGFNPVFRLLKSRFNGNMDIQQASFFILQKSDLPLNADGTVNNSAMTPTIGATPTLIPLQCWQNGMMTTWLNASPKTSSEFSQLVEFHSTALRNISIPMGSTLMLQLVVKNPSMGAGSVECLRMNRTTLPAGCWWKTAYTLPEATMLMNAPTWGSTVFPVSFSWMPFLRVVTVNYPDDGIYVSHPFDTTDTEGRQKTILWESKMPSGGGGALQLFARSGSSLSANGFDIVDAPAWEYTSPLMNPPPSAGIPVGSGRYVQFKAMYQSQRSHLPPDGGTPVGSTFQGPYRNDTPRLRWVRFSWPGPTKYVDIAAEMLKGPDCGIFTVKVNGQELVRGVTMEIEIFKDIRGVGGKPLRIRSGISTEVDPRNSGK